MDKQVESITRKSRIWQGHVDAWQRSGLSQRSYCESHGLAVSTFQLWRRRLVAGSKESLVNGCVELVPVPRTAQAHESMAGRRAAIVLCVRDYRLELGDDVHVQTLRRVIDVLEAR